MTCDPQWAIIRVGISANTIGLWSAAEMEKQCKSWPLQAFTESAEALDLLRQLPSACVELRAMESAEKRFTGEYHVGTSRDPWTPSDRACLLVLHVQRL